MSGEKEERGAKKKTFERRKVLAGLHLRKPRMLGFYPVLFLSEIEFLILIF